MERKQRIAEAAIRILAREGARGLTHRAVDAEAGNLIGMSPYGVLTDRDFPDVVNDPFDRTSGFGDLAYVGVFSPKQPIRFANGGKMVWGFGPTAMFPTAEKDVLGTGKYALGPAFVAAYLGEDWTLGFFPQHWWSVGGDSRRKDVSLTNIQYFIRRCFIRVTVLERSHHGVNQLVCNDQLDRKSVV